MKYIQFANTEDIPTDGIEYFNKDLLIVGVPDNRVNKIMTEDSVLLEDDPPSSSLFSDMVTDTRTADTPQVKLFVNRNGNISIYSEDPSYQAYISQWFIPAISWTTVANTAVLLRHCDVTIDPRIKAMIERQSTIKISDLITARTKPNQSKKSYIDLVRAGIALTGTYNGGEDTTDWINDQLGSLANKELNIANIKTTPQWQEGKGEIAFPVIIEGTIDGFSNRKTSNQVIIHTVSGTTVKVISYMPFGASEVTVFNQGGFIRMGLTSSIDLTKGLVEYRGGYTILPHGIDTKPVVFRSPTRRVPTALYSAMVWETIFLSELKTKVNSME